MAGAASPETALPVFPSPDFGFAFDDVNFSDRVLRIEILPDLPGSESAPNGNNRKRRRECDDSFSLSNANANANAANATGAEVAMDDEPYLPVEVRTIHISSPILAAKSPFFYKLFSNGMMESEQRHVTLRIQVSEEAAVMDLLNFMYSNTLPRTTPTAVLDVLMAADKFEVASCMTYCSRLLSSLPMSLESALLYLDLPSTVLMVDTVMKLADDARKFLATSFKDLKKHAEEVMKLPLVGFEAVISSDDLQVPVEGIIFRIVLKWAQLNYPKLEERREILSKRLLGLVRFPCMTYRSLKLVLTCADIDPQLASKVVMEALFLKAEAPYRQLGERSLYGCPDMKVVEFESPWQHSVVHLHLKREECAQDSVLHCAAGKCMMLSQTYLLGGQAFSFAGQCEREHNLFRLLLYAREIGSVGFTVASEVAVRMKPSGDFMRMCKGNHVFLGGNAVKFLVILTSAWTSFMTDDSPYFINGVLHLRAELVIKK